MAHLFAHGEYQFQGAAVRVICQNAGPLITELEGPPALNCGTLINLTTDIQVCIAKVSG